MAKTTIPTQISCTIPNLPCTTCLQHLPPLLYEVDTSPSTSEKDEKTMLRTRWHHPENTVLAPANRGQILYQNGDNLIIKLYTYIQYIQHNSKLEWETIERFALIKKNCIPIRNVVSEICSAHVCGMLHIGVYFNSKYVIDSSEPLVCIIQTFSCHCVSNT